jgi:hypothetical protein
MYILEKPGDRKGFTASLPLIFNRGLGQGEVEGGRDIFIKFLTCCFFRKTLNLELYFIFTEELGNIFKKMCIPLHAPRSRSQFSVKPRFLLYTFYVLIKAGPQRKYREGRKGR